MMRERGTCDSGDNTAALLKPGEGKLLTISQIQRLYCDHRPRLCLHSFTKPRHQRGEERGRAVMLLSVVSLFLHFIASKPKVLPSAVCMT